MAGYDPMAFEYVLGQVHDGKLFERFAQDLLCKIAGETFTPIGGVHDGGVDGLEHCFVPGGSSKTVYQMSVEADPKAKINKTIESLKKSSTDFTRFFYVTNRRISDQDAIEEAVFNQHAVTVKCRDVLWLAGQVNSNEGSLRTYLAFVESHFHKFNLPGASPILADFETDPRLFVFLRQQWESSGPEARLDQVLTDSLILFALEGTDPDTGKLMGREEILSAIKGRTGFLSQVTEKQVDRRLATLSSKPRRINHHSDEDKYCLPYETRLELQQKNIRDAALHEAFRAGTHTRLAEVLKTQGISVKDPDSLIAAVINQLFKQQGLEFANFVSQPNSSAVVERSLSDIISEAVDSSSVIPKNRTGVKSAVLEVMRRLIYHGTADEIEYLRKLANSYMMLFFLQCDPKLATYFSTLAGKLQVYVDNSLLVPAISELPLEQRHRRHWNLLAGANKSGVSLCANRATVSELASHVRRSLQAYEETYAGREAIFTNEAAIACIDQILIRSYFYARLQGAQDSFPKFIDRFVTPGSARMEDELIQWLEGTFGVRFIEDSRGVGGVNEQEVEQLTSELENHKASAHQAENDARTVLTVYALRERNNEAGSNGPFGYRTWWLSKDTLTQRAVEKCFGKKGNCYMRPDFLYNFICLAPSHAETVKVFDVMFPSILGVSVSHHMPQDVTDAVRKSLKEHSEREPARVGAVLRTLSEKLRTDGSQMNGQQVRHYLDECFAKAP